MGTRFLLCKNQHSVVLAVYYPCHKKWHSDWFLCILSSEFKTRYYPDENVRLYPITVYILDFVIRLLYAPDAWAWIRFRCFNRFFSKENGPH